MRLAVAARRRRSARLRRSASRKRCRNASSTSYDGCAMHGPTAARIRSRLAPSRSIAAMVASVTPAMRRASRMRRADHAGLGVGEQHRRAIRGQDAEQQARAVRDHRVGVRPLVLRPGALDDRQPRPNGPGARWRARRPARSLRSRDGGSRRSPRGRRCCHSRRSGPQARRSIRRRADRGSRAGQPSSAAARIDFDVAHSRFRMMMSSSA